MNEFITEEAKPAAPTKEQTRAWYELQAALAAKHAKEKEARPTVFDVMLDGVWLEVAAHYTPAVAWSGFDAGQDAEVEITRVTAGGAVDISDLLSSKQMDRLIELVEAAAKKRCGRADVDVTPARKLHRAAQMLAESVMSPEAHEHRCSIYLQAQAVEKLAREVMA